jgi:hypothetical protein
MNASITLDVTSEEVGKIRETEDQAMAIVLTVDELASVAGGRMHLEYEGQHR